MRRIQIEIEDMGPFICRECVRDPKLQALMKVASGRLCCSCGRTTDAGSLHVLVKVAGDMFRDRFEEFDDTYHDYRHGLTLSQAFGQILSIENEATCDVAAQYYRGVCPAAEREFFAPEMRYISTRLTFETQEHEQIFAEQRWIEQTRTFKHSRRYFNKEAKAFFSTLFDVALEAKNRSLFGPQLAAIRMLRAGGIVFRARRLAGADIGGLKESILADPKVQLGAPPRQSQSRIA